MKAFDPNYKLLDEMYQDDYYPAFLVDKVKDELQKDVYKRQPLEIAVFRNDVPMIHFLLEHGADPGLAEEQPLLLTAARCCGPEVVSLFAGQAAKLSPKQKERAFQEVRWGCLLYTSRTDGLFF